MQKIKAYQFSKSEDPSPKFSNFASCIMTLDTFRQTLSQNTPPAGLSPLLEALWYDGKNDWHRAHEIAQDITTNDGSWIHAYLHRKEGDHGNAAYWYRRAGRTMPAVSLREEWKQIAQELLAQYS